MGKTAFRCRAIDCNQSMLVYLAEEVPDLSEYVGINRTIPQMPSGMDKEEEQEYHLQQVILAQQNGPTGISRRDAVVIPIPKVSKNIEVYNRIYPANYKLPKQLIKVQASLNLEPELPEYDLDEEDDKWLQSQGFDISPVRFERIMDALEKRSEYQVAKPEEIKLFVQEDDDVILAIYDYWLTKRYKAVSEGKQLMLQVKLEKRENSSTTDPYVAFRRRGEKMQTRKHRKNDEESYEKMLRLRVDLRKAVLLTEMMKKREELKRELINVNIAEKRYLLKNYVEESLLHQLGESKVSIFAKNGESHDVRMSNYLANQDQLSKNEYISLEWPYHIHSGLPAETPMASTSTSEKDDIDRYAFKRVRGCRYHAPAQQDVETELLPYDGNVHFRYFPTFLNSRYSGSSSSMLRFVGLARHRMGRGGRIILDRMQVAGPLEGKEIQTVDDLQSLPSIAQSNGNSEMDLTENIGNQVSDNWFGLPTPSPSPIAPTTDVLYEKMDGFDGNGITFLPT